MASIAELIKLYEVGPGQLRQAIEGMTPSQMDAKPIPGKWSTREVVCHLADCEPMYADRMKRVIAEEEPKFYSANPDLFLANLKYPARDIEEELILIEAVRRHMLRILKALSPADFQRVGIHSADGPLTLETLLSRIANHIPHHIKFIDEKRTRVS